MDAPFDVYKNEFEVAVKKRNEKVYFTDGWTFFKEFYRLLAGTWITVIFANRHLFLFEVRNMHGDELVYPQSTPPQRMLLQNHSAHAYVNPFIPYGSSALLLPTTFYNTIVKELTASDVTFGMLVSCMIVYMQNLNWLDFCQSAFRAEKIELTVIDCLGILESC